MMKAKYWKAAVSAGLIVVFSSLSPLGDTPATKGIGSSGFGVNPGGKTMQSVKAEDRTTTLPITTFPREEKDAVSDTPGPQPEMVDLTTLYVAKSNDGTVIYLSWNGDDPLFNIFRCYEPSFQSTPQTLECDSSATSLEVAANSAHTLECYEVAGASVVGLPTQGAGYDPIPAPTPPTTSAEGLWWGDTVDLAANYLDPIDKGNVTFMGDLPVRADSVVGSGDYATSATFTIPDDARGFYPLVEAHGRSSDPAGSSPYVSLYAPGVGPYSSIKGVSFAPQTGNIWVAASGIVQEVDLFLHEPVPSTEKVYTDASTPYISRVTTDGRILYVDGVYGVTTIYQVNVSSGAKTTYASTKDDSFTRSITPRGIAVDPDGSACFIADSYSNKVVKIPVNAGTGSSTIVDTWGGRSFSYGFPTPCGMDINVGHQVFVSSNDGYIYQLSGPSSWSYDINTGAYIRSIQIDREYSISTYCNYNFSSAVGMAEAYNRHEIGSNPAAYHGALVFATSDGYIDLDPHWGFQTYRHFPQRVILNNSGQSIGYSTDYQSADRIVQLRVVGWENRPLKLTVIDPPDLSPYAPDGGCLQGSCTPSLPYKANDNIGNTDYGICAAPDCSDGATVSKTLYCDSEGSLTYYMKVPARYSGDNFQVEVQKTDYYGNDLPEARIPMCSPIYTSWKRVFVERDKMFRKGGVLYSSYGATGKCGGSGQPACCGTDGELPCNQIKVYDWTNVANGDTIVIFDETNTAETGGEIRTITNDPYDNGDGTKTITLSAVLTKNYFTGRNETTGDLDFSNGHSGGMGVLSGCDSASNQINASNSCFYEADMREIEKTYNDGYVEFYAPRSGMSAVPYVGEQVQFYGSSTDDMNSRMYFREIWCKHKSVSQDTGNYLYLLGCRGGDVDCADIKAAVGTTESNNKLSYIFRETLEQYGTCLSYTSDQINLHTQTCTKHEYGHQLRTNWGIHLVCSPEYSEDAGMHDVRPWWAYETEGCPNPNPCLMDPKGGVYSTPNEINRFCKMDLFLGDPSIRTLEDPIPY